MIILKKPYQAVEFRFIPRQGEPGRVIIRDEQTKEETELVPDFEERDNGYSFTPPMFFEDNRRYSMVVTDLDYKVLYRGLIQTISEQTEENYSLDEGEYLVPQEEVETKKYKFI